MKKSLPGNIKFTYLQEDDWVDYRGKAPKELLDIFSSDNTEEKRNKALDSPLAWSTYSRLSPLRRNVISWVNFVPGSYVLEVGADCGSITEELVKHNVEVVANDASKERCIINAQRNRDADNLSIATGNIMQYKSDKKFDYIVCIGILQNAHNYVGGSDAYTKLLKHLSSLLKPSGTLILGVENKLGFKYLAGAKEDNTRELFEGVNDYFYSKKHMKTFGRIELKNILSESFSHQKFYYPYPDHNLPQLIYSDSYYPGGSTSFPLSSLPSPALNLSRYHLFSEKLFMNSLEDNGLYRDLANSFIVLASNKKIDESTSFASFQTNRSKDKCLLTKIINRSGKLQVSKTAKPEAVRHLENLGQTYENIKDSFASSDINLVEAKQTSHNTVTMPYIAGDLLETRFVKLLLNKDVDGVADLSENYIKRVFSLPVEKLDPSQSDEYTAVFGKAYNKTTECISGVIDLTFDNFVIDGRGSWNLFDYEWSFPFKVPKEYVVGRTFYWLLLQKYSEFVDYLGKTSGRSTKLEGVYIPRPIQKVVDPFMSNGKLSKIIVTEQRFQKYVRNVNIQLATPSKAHKINDVERLELEQRKLNLRVKELEQAYGETGELAYEYAQELNEIKKSLNYRVANRINKLRKNK